MGAFSIWHWLVVLGIVLLIFGPSRLPCLGKELGSALRGFKESIQEKDITPATQEETKRR